MGTVILILEELIEATSAEPPHMQGLRLSAAGVSPRLLLTFRPPRHHFIIINIAVEAFDNRQQLISAAAVVYL